MSVTSTIVKTAEATSPNLASRAIGGIAGDDDSAGERKNRLGMHYYCFLQHNLNRAKAAL